MALAAETRDSVQPADSWPPNYSPAAAWWMVVVAMIFQISSLIDRQIIAILVPEMRADLDLNTFQIFLLQGLAFALFYGAMGLFIGGLVDRYSRQRIMFAGITLWSLAAAATGLARNYAELFAARLMVGFGEGAISPASQSLISTIFPRSRMSTPMSFFTVSGTVGLSLSFALGGFLLDYLTRNELALIGELAPWRQVLIVTGLRGVLLGFLAFTIRTPDAPRPTKDEASWGNFFRFLGRNFRLFGGMILGLGMLAMITQGAMTASAAFARDVLGVSATQAGRDIAIAVGVGGIGGGIAAGFLIDWFFRRGVRDMVFKTLAVLAILIPVPVAFAFMARDAALLFAVLTLLVGTLGAAYGPGLAAVQMVSPIQMRGRFAALAVLVSNLFGFAFGPMLIGAITDYVFFDPLRIGDAVAITVVLLGPLASAILWLTRKHYLRALDTN